MKILTPFENQPLLNYLALQSLLQKPVECSELIRDRRSRDRMVVSWLYNLYYRNLWSALY